MTDFETKDSGERAVFDSGMQRDTQDGKPRFDLIIPVGVPYEEQLLTRFAKLMERGAFKYTERNWEQANSREEIDRMRASGLRHFMQWFCGERDEDHAAAVLFNIMAAEATEYKLNAAGVDPRADPTDEVVIASFDGSVFRHEYPTVTLTFDNVDSDTMAVITGQTVDVDVDVIPIDKEGWVGPIEDELEGKDDNDPHLTRWDRG